MRKIKKERERERESEIKRLKIRFYIQINYVKIASIYKITRYYLLSISIKKSSIFLNKLSIFLELKLIVDSRQKRDISSSETNETIFLRETRYLVGSFLYFFRLTSLAS